MKSSLCHALQRWEIPFPGDDPAVLVLDLTASLGELPHDDVDRLQEVQWFKSGDDTGLAVILGHEFIGLAPDNHGDVPGPDEAVKPEVR